MEVKREKNSSEFIRIGINENDKEVAHGYLFLIKNDLHDKPYGLIEDIFVIENNRGKGFGKKILEKILEEAKQQGCYKVLAQSRYGKENIHDWYMRHAFKDHGKNFRLDISYDKK